jgi:hypothetical protein
MATQTIERRAQRPAADLQALFPGRFLSVRSEPVPARAEVLTTTLELERVQQLLIERYKIAYRLVMLFYRLGRRLRGRRSVADGAALAITVE